MSWQEILGYVASVVVAVSLMMRSIVRLRWVNLAGALLFTVYGLLIKAYPVAALNFMIVAINVYFLWKIRRTRETFAVVEMDPGSQYVAEFVATHGEDIHRYQPGVALDDGADRHVLVALRDLVPAGLLVVEPAGDGVGRILVDYATPAYRDLKSGRYLFGSRRDVFRDLGFRRLETAPGSPAHAAYLERVGFVRNDDTYAIDLVGTDTGGR